MDYKIDASYSSDFLAAVDMGGNIQSTEDNPVRVFESDTDANDTYLLIRGMWQGELLALGNQQGQFHANGVAYDFTKANLETVLANMSLALASRTLLTVPLSNPQTTLPLISDPIPMSGLVSMSQISFTTPIPPINMKRAVAES